MGEKEVFGQWCDQEAPVKKVGPVPGPGEERIRPDGDEGCDPSMVSGTCLTHSGTGKGYLAGNRH